MREHGGKIPKGVLRTVVPAAPDAWITALRRYGTMSFGEVAAAAIRLARDGFPMYPLMAESLKRHAADHRAWPSSAAIFLPDGRPPEAGDMFRQTDLAGSLQYMADEEHAAPVWRRRFEGGPRGRARSRARRVLSRRHRPQDRRLHEGEGGCCRPRIWPITARRSVRPERRRFGDLEVFTCGAWCQGPVLLQTLALLEGADLAGLGHNSADYVHRLAEALKLAFADREAYYGDPALGRGAAGDPDLRGIRGRAPPADPPRPGLAGNAAAGQARRRDRPRRRGFAARLRRAQPRARHLLCLRRRPSRQSVLGDAQRRLLRLAGGAGHRADPVQPRLAIAPRPAPSGRCRPRQAAAADARTRPWRSRAASASCRSARRAATCRARRCCRSC